MCETTPKYLKKYNSSAHCELMNFIIFQENLFLKIQTAIKVALQIEKSSEIDKKVPGIHN